MAQPVFDGHPLEEYFQGRDFGIITPHLTHLSHAVDSGEASETIPGGIADSSLQPYLTGYPSVSKHAERMEKLCFLIFGAVQSLRSFFSSDRASLRTQAFAERFKYGVISSSLLSPAFAATPMVDSHRRGMSQTLPGKLSNSHSRTPSAAESMVTDLSMPSEHETPIWPMTLSFTIAIAACSARFYFFALLLLAGTLYYIHVHRVDIHSKPDVMTPSLLALQHLISAGHLWDTVINDTFTILEKEEQSIFYGPTTPLTPSSSLRVALSTSLLTTQTQCDNVRQLLSAITSPSELAQLSEMYAPPSPIKSTFARSSDSRRPLSHPGSPPRSTPMSDRMRKRSTWNGSYASLALVGDPPAFQLAQRREKRRSDLSALIGTTTPCPARSGNSISSPPQHLADVSEEEDGMVTAESSLAEDEADNSFGTAALDLYRNRVSGGLQALELSQRSTPTRGYSTRRRTTMSPGSKYTSMHTTRHPFSLSSLRQSYQNALASKRFACSHLLALRFEDDEDEVYWEDVRSVMSLLTSTLVDASSRLSEVLDDVEEHHLDMDDEHASGANTPSSLTSPPRPLSQAIEQIVSFAPTPSHLSRFASHVGAISSALDDAREHLEQCVVLLKADRTTSASTSSPGHSSHPSSSSMSDNNRVSHTFGEPAEHPAIVAYERLRRELGLALRECERGREKLVRIVAPPTPPTDDEVLLASGKEGDGNGNGNKDADADVQLTVVSPSGDVVHLPDDVDGDKDVDEDKEETDKDLLWTSEMELVPPGIEQVFEADSTVGTYTLQKSGESREERIRRVKAEREREREACERQRWGPTDDVVQELKDVIWKVGQRRHSVAG